MPGFTKGQNPIAGLSGLKRFMEDKIANANESSNIEDKLKYLEEAHAEHFQKMGSLTTIYKGGSEKIEELKTQIRTLYEQMIEMKQKCKDSIQMPKKGSSGFFSPRSNDSSSEESDEYSDDFQPSVW
jgi:chromosome segregation ATPase